MKRIVIAAALLLASCGRSGASPDLDLSDGWARATAPGQTTAAAYLTISNNGTGEDRLLGAATDAADQSMIHESSSEGGVAKMRHLGNGLDIPSKAALQLSPGGTHIMLMGLRKPLMTGETFMVKLRFERSEPRTIEVKVVDPAAAGQQGEL